jgi:hypothetical protein
MANTEQTSVFSMVLTGHPFRQAVALQQGQSYLRKLTVADAAALCREQIAAAQGLPDAVERIHPYKDTLEDLAGFGPVARRFRQRLPLLGAILPGRLMELKSHATAAFRPRGGTRPCLVAEASEMG